MTSGDGDRNQTASIYSYLGYSLRSARYFEEKAETLHSLHYGRFCLERFHFFELGQHSCDALRCGAERPNLPPPNPQRMQFKGKTASVLSHMQPVCGSQRDY